MTDTQRWQLAIAAVLLAGLVYWLKPVLTPFAAAALVAYLGDPIVGRLTRWKLSRTLAVTVVFAAMVIALLVLLLVLVPLIEAQIARLIARLPDYLDWLRAHAVPWLAANFGVDPAMFDTAQIVAMLQEHWKEAGGIAATVVSTVSHSGWALIHGVLGALVVPVVAFYLMRDWPEFMSRVHELIPRPIEPTVTRLARESDEVLGAFVRGQLLVMLVLGIFYSVALAVMGLDLALLIGLGAGAISFVPYLGGIVGIGAGLIAAAVQFHDVTHVAIVLGIFWVGHMLEGWVLAPWLVGDKIGLHPVAVIFAIFCGGELAGFLGVLLALPVAAVIAVLLRHAHERYRDSALYGADGAAVVVAATDADVAPAKESAAAE